MASVGGSAAETAGVSSRSADAESHLPICLGELAAGEGFLGPGAGGSAAETAGTSDCNAHCEGVLALKDLAAAAAEKRARDGATRGIGRSPPYWLLYGGGGPTSKTHGFPYNRRMLNPLSVH